MATETVQAILRSMPQCAQRQDSTADQLADLWVVANRLGMYDAADVLASLAQGGGEPAGSDREDAEGYRWLLAHLQQAYDGQMVEVGDVAISCHMVFGRGSYRRVEANIHWSDQRDEPLGLSAAIDAARQAQTQAGEEAHD